MRSFLEQYGTAIFTLVLVAILIAFASPMGKMIKTAINTQIQNIDDITTEEVKDVSGQNLKVEDNSDTAYEKQIPDKTQNVSVNKIGGKTIVWNQLVPDECINISTTLASDVSSDMWGEYITTINNLIEGHKVYVYCNTSSTKVTVAWENNTNSFITGN